MFNRTGSTQRLSPRDRELTAIGAALASHCTACLAYHIPLARKVGLSDEEIREAVELADQVRRVPAEGARQTALALLDGSTSATDPAQRQGCGNRTEGSCQENPREHAAVDSGPRGSGLDHGRVREDNDEGTGSCCG